MSNAPADKDTGRTQPTGPSTPTGRTKPTGRTWGTSSHIIRGIPPDADAWVQEYFDALPTLFLELDRSGAIVRINERTCKVLGYQREDLIGRNWFDLALAPDARRETTQLFTQVIAGELPPLRNFQNTIQNRLGESQTVHWCTDVLVDEDGHVTGTVSLGTVITGHQLVDEQLAQTQRLLQDMEKALDVSAIVAFTDAKGVITYCNDKFVRISGYSRDELIGRTHKIINAGFHPKSFWKEMWETIESGKVWKADIKNQAKDGSYYWVATTIVPFMDDSGEPYQYMAVRHEITARKEARQALARAVQELEEVSHRERERAEQLAVAHEKLVQANKRIREESAKVIQAEKLSSIGLLAAGVAHEVNNPLAGIMGCLKALRSGTLTAEREAEYLDAIEDGLQRIETIVRGLLDFARPQRSAEAHVDLAELIDRCSVLLTPTMRKRGVEIQNDIEHGRFRVSVDRQQMMQAAMNVLLNAIQASPKGSTVTVSLIRDGDRVGITFRDQGPGIPEEDRARVCDPFYTTKAEGEGTGLGLAVTMGIIEAHGGGLTIGAPESGGTEVTFWLPAPDLQESES